MIYTYHCEKCDSDLDLFTDDYNQEPPPCPGCGNTTKKVIRQPPPVHYIGPDWYETEWGNSRHNCAGRLTSAIEQDDPEDK